MRRTELPQRTTHGLAAGMYTAASLPAGLTPPMLVPLGSMLRTTRYRGCKLRFGALPGAPDNAAISVRIAAARPIAVAVAGGGTADGFVIDPIAALTVTTAAGVDRDNAPGLAATDIAVDTIASLAELGLTSTPLAGVFTELKAAYAGPPMATLSPADDTREAELVIPDAFGAAALAVEMVHATATGVVYAEPLT